MRLGAKDMITTRTSSTLPLQEDITFDTSLGSVFIITSNVSTFSRLIEPTFVSAQLPISALSLEQSY
ncbi:MAG: hypothetical protein ACRD8Z_01775 [Nitrososphaeraceae archaeon]